MNEQNERDKKYFKNTEHYLSNLNMSGRPTDTMCWGCVWFRFSVDLDVQIEDEEEDGAAAGPHGGG